MKNQIERKDRMSKKITLFPAFTRFSEDIILDRIGTGYCIYGLYFKSELNSMDAALYL